MYVKTFRYLIIVFIFIAYYIICGICLEYKYSQNNEKDKYKLPSVRTIITLTDKTILILEPNELYYINKKRDYY